MVPRETLIRDAAEVDAALIPCGLKRVRSTLAKPTVVFTQRETVLLLTGLYTKKTDKQICNLTPKRFCPG